MTTKVTTADVPFTLWKKFQVGMVKSANQEEGTLRGSKIITSLIEKFLKGEVKVDLFKPEKTEKNHRIGLHINEKVWLKLDHYLAEEKAKYIGDEDKQELLTKGNIIIKLLRFYLKDNGVGAK